MVAATSLARWQAQAVDGGIEAIDKLVAKGDLPKTFAKHPAGRREVQGISRLRELTDALRKLAGLTPIDYSGKDYAMGEEVTETTEPPAEIEGEAVPTEPQEPQADEINAVDPKSGRKAATPVPVETDQETGSEGDYVTETFGDETEAPDDGSRYPEVVKPETGDKGKTKTPPANPGTPVDSEPDQAADQSKKGTRKSYIAGSSE